MPQEQVMLLFGAVLILTYVGIAHERLNKTLAAMLGAIAAVVIGIVLGIFSYHDVYSFMFEELSVLGVIVGTGILVEVVSHSGLFQHIGIRIVKTTKGDVAMLFLYLNLLTVLLVSFLTIVPAMLIVISLTLVTSRSLDFDPKPFLISEAIVANSGALTTLASSIPNLIIGAGAGIPYVQFLLVSAPFTIISFGIGYQLLKRVYSDRLKSKRAYGEELEAIIAEFDEWAVVKDKVFFRRSAVILVATILGFVSAQWLGIGLDFVALAGASAALFLSGIDEDEAIRAIDWSIVVFFVGLFTLIGAVEASGLLEAIAEVLGRGSGGSGFIGAPIILWTSAALSGFVDNIPLSATMVPIVKTMSSGTGIPAEPLWWSLVLGANLGGNATPIGSISCVLAIHLLKSERRITVSWPEFMKVGVPILLMQMLVASAYIFAFTYLRLFPAIP
ncbi:MAG: ArsB/NhaD family transporter [Candidatus Bathyarchaeia archaeon]